MGKKINSILAVTAVSLAGMYAFNKFVETTSTRNNLLKENDGNYYEWKFGNIFYKKMGKGPNVLFIHDTNTKASCEEWSKISKKIAKDHTVYLIDLLGCGRSDKPALQYTNYMYVQLINDFAKDIINGSTDIITTNMSASFAVMAKTMNPDQINKLILINPVSLDKLKRVPTTILKIQQQIIQLPIIGTFIYNLLNTPAKTSILFKTKYFSRPQLVTTKLVETYYESAHLGNSKGKYLYSSLAANYMNIDIEHAITNIKKDFYIVACRDLKDNLDTIDTYHNTNKNIIITSISNGGLYPQLEIPEKLLKVLKQTIKE